MLWWSSQTLHPESASRLKEERQDKNKEGREEIRTQRKDINKNKNHSICNRNVFFYISGEAELLRKNNSLFINCKWANNDLRVRNWHFIDHLWMSSGSDLRWRRSWRRRRNFLPVLGRSWWEWCTRPAARQPSQTDFPAAPPRKLATHIALITVTRQQQHPRVNRQTTHS